MKTNKLLLKIIDIIVDIILWIRDDSLISVAISEAYGTIFLPVFQTHEHFNTLGLFTLWPVITTVAFLVATMVFVTLFCFGFVIWIVVVIAHIIYYAGTFLFFSKSKERQ